MKIENIFVFIALFFGLLYVFILPPFQSVDESMHFYRTYQISSGRFTAQNIDGKIGGHLPLSLSNFYADYAPFIKNIDKKTNLREIKRNFERKLEKDRTVFTEFPNTSLYSPVCYISQAAGVLPAMTAGLGPAAVFYAGRITNLLFYCLLVYFAIKTIPFFKLPMFLLALMPLSLSLGSAFTSDVAVLGLNFLWIAFILKILAGSRSRSDFAVLIPLALLISLSKSYILLLPLILLLPMNIFKNRKQYLLFLSGVIFTALAGGFIWYLQSKGLTLNMSYIADSAAQVEFIKAHPVFYLGVLLKTFIVKTPRLFITMIGVLGWQDTRLDFLTYILYPVLMYFAVVSDNFNFQLQRRQKALIFAVLVFGVCITYTSLYLMWSPVGNPVVLGLNGKYFIPLALPALLLFKNNRAVFDYEKVKTAVIIMVILILFSSELSLLHRFYDITPQ
ncbi:MAG: DUF2142 domain-containing protein, partial [Heliobacteriaceae bacterium]|nr:DUF2142 domain-containing protein [Heliobacteriaceae bacterium]